MRSHAALRPLAGLLLAAVLAGPAAAQPLVYDGFGYGSGSLSGQNGGSGWAGAWSGSGASVIPGVSLEHPTDPLITSGGKIVTTPDSGFHSVARPMSTPLGDAGPTIWLSFLVRKTSAPAGNAGIALGNLFIGDPVSGGQWALQRFDGAGQVSSGVTAATNTTFFLAVRIDFAAGPDTVQLYVNPPAGPAGPGAPQAVKADLDVSGAGSVLLAFGGIDVTNATYEFDEIRLGATYADVAPPVPEPATVGLIAAAGLGLVGVIRRRMRRG